MNMNMTMTTDAGAAWPLPPIPFHQDEAALREDILDWVEAHGDDPLETRAMEWLRRMADPDQEDQALEELVSLQEAGSALAAYVCASMQMEPGHGEGHGTALMAGAAGRGFGPACWRMALHAREGDAGTAFARSWDWLARGAAAGSLDCAAEMAELFLRSEVHLSAETGHVLAWQLLDFAGDGRWRPLRLLLDLARDRTPGAVPADCVRQALDLLRRLAAEGHGQAMLHLAGLLAEGRLLDRDAAAARALYERALEAGLDEALSPLARLALEDGAAPAADRALARERLERRCMEDDGPAHELLARHVMEAGGDPRLGRSLMRRAAELGRPELMTDCLVFGVLAARTPERRSGAAAMLCDPALDGSPMAAAQLALLRLLGLDGEPADADAGLDMLRRCLADGLDMAAGLLAGSYLMGMGGTSRDGRIGWRWALEGLRRHDPRSVTLLAADRLRPVRECEGSPLDEAQARAGIAWACDRGDALATLHAGLMLARGEELSLHARPGRLGREDGLTLAAHALRHSLARLEPMVLLAAARELDEADGSRATALARGLAGRVGVRDAETPAALAAFLRSAVPDPSRVWLRLDRGLPVLRPWPLD